MENTVKERLISFLRYKRITQRAFVTMLGLSGAYINSIRKSISPDVMLGIAKHFPELNRDWLLYGEGEMLKGQSIGTAINNGTNNGNIIGYNNGNATINNNNVEEVEAEAIPYVETSVVARRNFDIRKAINNDSELLKQKTLDELFSPISFMQKMADDSMANVIQQGDVIFVKFLPQEANIVSGKIYLIDTNSYGTLVRQVYVNEDSFTLHAFNPSYDDIEVQRDDIFNFGRVVHSLRSTFTLPDEALSKIAQESTQQVTKLIGVIEKQNERQEKLMDLLLNKK